jgi:hypothetical protein
MRAVLLVLMFSFISALTAYGQTNDTPPPIAVLELASDNIPRAELRLLSDRLRIELFKTGRFDVIERERMEAILTEQGVQQTECMATDCAVEMGQLIGVEQMVAGTVGRIGNVHTISVRLINVETGRMESIAVQDCACPLDQMLTRVMAEVAAELAGDTTIPDAPAPVTMKSSDPVPTPAVTRPKSDRDRYADNVYLGIPGVGFALMRPWKNQFDIGMKLDGGNVENQDDSFAIFSVQAMVRYNLMPGRTINPYIQSALGLTLFHEGHRFGNDRNSVVPIPTLGFGASFGRFGVMVQVPSMPWVALTYNF